MYLKIHFYDKLLKFIFKDELKTYEGLTTFIEEKTGIPKCQLKIVFTDLEGDLINITSNDDIEFFLDQKRNEEFKEIIVGRTRDSEFSQHKLGQRFNRRVSTDPDKPKRHTINVFKENSPNNTIDWSISTVKRQNDCEDKADDTDLKSLGFSHISVRKKSTNDDAVRALEGCFTQLMSQVFEMKITYESKISTLESDQKTLLKNLANIETIVTQLKTENAALKSEISTLTKDISDIKSQDDKLTIQSRSYGMETMLNSGLLSFEKRIETNQIIEPFKNQRQSCNSKIPSVMPKYDCRMCDMKPIVGKRYICLDCKHFHTCEICATTKFHEHPLRLVINSVQMADSNEDIAKNFLKRKSSEPVSLQQSLVDIKELPFDTKDSLNNALQEMLDKKANKLMDSRTDNVIVQKNVSQPSNGLKSIRNFIIAHVENDRKEYEKRKRMLDITFGETLNDQQKDELIKKDIRLSFDDFSEKLKEVQKLDIAQV